MSIHVEVLPAREAIAKVDGACPVCIRVRPGAASGDRRPVALGLVVDISGSMAEPAAAGGEGAGRASKMRFVKEAAHFLVDLLDERDTVFIAGFTDGVHVVAQPGAAGPLPRAGLHAAIEHLHPRGSTNLEAGLRCGLDLLAGREAARMVVLSDGEANAGDHSVQGLTALARQAAAAGITVSTIGVGLDYNSVLLAAIADAGGGDFRYVENVRAAESALTGELFQAAELAARRVTVDVTVPAAASIPDGNLNGYPFTVIKGGIRVELGDLARQRDVVVLVSTVDASAAGDALVVAARVSGVGTGGERVQAKAKATLRLVAGDEAATAGEDPEIFELVLRLLTARAELQAAVALERGDRAGARAAISSVRRFARSLGPAAETRAERGGLLFDRVLQEADTRGNAKRLFMASQAKRRGLADVPFPRSYWVRPGALLAGCYPGDLDPDLASDKLRRLRAAGVDTVVDLMVPGEVSHGNVPFRSYAKEAVALGMSVFNHPIPDGGTVDAARMQGILDAIDAAVDAGGTVYVHCWGGRGRTGTVVGCWLRRHGADGMAGAVRRITELRAACPDVSLPSPETARQVEMVEQWPVRA